MKIYKTKSFLLLSLFIVTVLSITGCSTVNKKQFDFSKVIWPQPPNPTRIRLLRIIHSDLDIRVLSKEEKLFGMKPGFFFLKPADIVVDKRDNIYVSDLANAFVAMLNLDKKTAKRLPLKGLANPLGLAYSAKLDWLAIVSPVGKEIYVYQLPQLKELFRINSKSGVELKNPVDAAIDAERGRIYVADSKAGYIRVYDLKGKYVSDIGRPGNDKDGLFAPTYLALDKKGNIYVSEVFNFRFHVFTPDGKTVTTIGQLGTYAGDFSRPKGIAVDNDGLIYVADAAFGNVQIFDLKGNVYLFFGTNGKGPGFFQIPEGMYIDNKDRLYVADQRNARVQVFQIYSDEYYKEHPEEAAKFSEPAVTVVPDKSTNKTGIANTPATSTPITNTPSATPPSGTQAEPATQESQPSATGESTSAPTETTPSGTQAAPTTPESQQPPATDNSSSTPEMQKEQPSPAPASGDTNPFDENIEAPAQ